MFKKAVLTTLFSFVVVSQASAQAPKVAVDIAPLHSLVAQVMDGVDTPDLLIRPEASPHEYTLRPSEAKALADANIVFWIGEGLTPWLEKPLSTLANSATKIEMMEVDGTTLHKFREGATFEAHDHGHEEGHNNHHGDEHAHKDDHDEHHHGSEHAHHEDHDDHADEHAHHEDHDEHGHEEHHHEGNDPHVWLDPKNAEVWLNTIAKTLANVDSENAQTYQKNAKAAIARLQKINDDIAKQAAQLKDFKFIVFHDAYQYFELRYGLQAAGAISISNAADPSPSRIAEIRQTVKDLGVTCVFTEPQFNPQMVNTVFENSTVKTIGTMDPLGAEIETGKAQYNLLLTGMIDSIKQCQK